MIADPGRVEPGSHRGREVFASRALRLGDWVCRPSDTGPGPTEFNRTPRIVFVREGAYVKHVSGRRIFADPNHVVFFDPGERYRVSHPVADGDHCTELRLAIGTLRDIVAEEDPTAGERADIRFPGTHAPVDSDAFLLHRRLVQYLGRPGGPDPVAVEEAALTLVGSAVRGARRDRGCGSAGTRRATERAHRECVEAVKAMIGRRYRERLTLDEIATGVSYSPYHLCRVFGRHTGLTVHRYLMRTRLRAALERVAQGEEDLGQLALGVGFCSHSHLSDAFRREFGCPPSALRDMPSARRIGELCRAVAGASVEA